LKSFKSAFECTLAAFLTILPAAGVLYANEAAASPSLNTNELEPVIVSATRIPTEQKGISGNASVFTAEDIEKMPARDLGEVLKYIPGVDIKVANQFGQSTSLSIQGSYSRHVLLMVDGIPFNTQLSGQANPTRIPVEHIQQIEVIKGASSSAWGSSLGGVINVITKDVGDTETPQGRLTSSFAEFSTTKNSLELSGRRSKLGYFVSGSYFETDGTRSISDVQETKTFTKLAYSLSEEATLTGSFGYSGANVRDGVKPNNRWNSNPYNSRYGRLTFEMDKDTSNSQISYKYNDQDITTDIYNATTGALVSSTVSNNVYHGLGLNHYFNVYEDDFLVLGADFDWYTLKSNNYLDTSKTISMQAPYMNYTKKLDHADITGGIRFDNNQRFGSQTSPSLGGVYHFGDEHHSSAQAKISRAFSAPPLLWIYNSDLSLLVGPSPDLKAERSTVYEMGFETELFSPLTMELDLFRADVKDAIALVFKGGLFVQENFRKFRRQGASLRLNYELNDHFTFYGSGAFNDVENRATRETVRDQGIARQSFTLGTNYRNSHGFKLNLHGYYNRWSSAPSLEPNDRKFIFDTKMTQAFDNVRNNIDAEVFLNIYNLANSKYWSSITFPLPKRYFEGGFSLKF